MGSPSPSPVGSKKHVVIVGGGISGLAAAVELTSHRIPVTLLEQKPLLGGRAYSFKDATTGDIIDNGQHVLIAGYERTMRFLDTIGARDQVSVQPRPSFLFHHPEKGFRKLQLPRLPAPLHLFAGVLATDLFSISDRMRLFRAGWSLLSWKGIDVLQNKTIQEWLDSTGQSEETKRSFWEPLAVSIMNEHVEKAAAGPFLNSLRHAFLGSWRNASLALPRTGLSHVYVDGAQSFITLHGGRIYTGADVVEVIYENDLVTGVKLRDNLVVDCSVVVLAVPYYRLATMFSEELAARLSFSSFLSIESSPIVSIHLWFVNDFMNEEMVGLIGRRVQWLFNRRRICNEHGSGGHLSAVISAAHDFVSCTNEKLVQIAMEDLRSVYSSIPAEPIHAVVIREKRATFSSTPKAERRRASQQTDVPNLFLAGDWTDTGFPATIEGAVLSAERCAKLTIEWLHSP
ncbi:MAG: FAD-dependent oxidoreductase [Ignavibacteriae bacterium]|nr:FAD-dependent oxidoreductase [Ignavibacteriota bacterium]